VRVILAKHGRFEPEECMTMMKTLVVGAALAVLVASPAFAQRQGIGDTAPQAGTAVHPEGAPSRTRAVPRAGAESRRHAAG
jgi:hypothetical protein